MFAEIFPVTGESPAERLKAHPCPQRKAGEILILGR